MYRVEKYFLEYHLNAWVVNWTPRLSILFNSILFKT